MIGTPAVSVLIWFLTIPIQPRENTGTDIREMIVATCMECGKKISKFFGRSNLIEGKLICGKCDDQRREKERMEAKETKRADSK